MSTPIYAPTGGPFYICKDSLAYQRGMKHDRFVRPGRRTSECMERVQIAMPLMPFYNDKPYIRVRRAKVDYTVRGR